ncbi:MAG: BREX-1 system phosphatase PglZ type B, partial [Anaerolineaceae bacterium]|nr:BREX-1 system phosphatase PglZ type B [Anaerolineaceae bacterium]
MTWSPVWARFCEAPKRYLNIPDQIRKCKHPDSISWYTPGQSDYDGWPQWNEEQEKELRKQLRTLASVPPHEARKKIGELEKEHGSRRNFVWAELGKASLSQAMEHLSVLAKNTTNALAAGTIDDLAAGYQNTGWQVDDALIRALACMDKQEDIEAVKMAIRTIYKPWVEESARYLQKMVEESGYPGGTAKTHKTVHYKDGDCIFFVDGLRFDIAKRFVTKLKDQGYEIEEKLAWAALPSITATGKPAVAPVHDKISGNDTTIDFEPCIAESGQSLKGGYHLKKLLKAAGWEVEPLSKINVNGNAWYEFGNIDHKGHEQGWELAKSIEEILTKILDQVMKLIGMGWSRVHIVTDHGWLLLPGNLPKIELSRAQTETKWGRCASIKPGASTDERLYPWYWNPNKHFALADGISCFKNGEEYAHG